MISNTNKIDDTIIEAIQDKKGASISVSDLSGVHSAPASTFIICQGKTPSQTSAIADNVIEKTNEKERRKPSFVDGMRNGQWIIIDFGETLVHVFTPEFREFYNLEDLWSDGVTTQIPDLD